MRISDNIFLHFFFWGGNSIVIVGNGEIKPQWRQQEVPSNLATMLLAQIPSLGFGTYSFIIIYSTKQNKKHVPSCREQI